MPQDPELLQATKDLADRVEQLGRHLNVSKKQAHRTRILVIGMSILVGLAMIVMVVMVNLFQQVEASVAESKRNAVISCQNANEFREANRILWDTILALSSSDGDDTSEDKVRRQKFRTWIHDLYAPRDCSDLSKKYVIPSPPEF